MDPISITELCLLTALFGFCLGRNWESSAPKKQVTISGLETLARKIVEEQIEELEGIEREIGEDRLEGMEHQLVHLQQQADHTSLVVSKMLDYLNLEHQVLPPQDRLVKRTKERSA